MHSVPLHVSRITQLLRNPSADSIKEKRKQDPAVMALDDESADAVFAALSSTTARHILTTLYDQPRTASEIADAVDTSLQNVNYHVTRLTESGVIEAVETWYSEQGREMTVYAPTNDALVLFAGDDLHRTSLLESIKRLIGFVGLFALLGGIIEGLARHWVTRPEQDPNLTVTSQPAGEPLLLLLSPGVLFFLGSLLALLLVATWRYYRPTQW